MSSPGSQRSKLTVPLTAFAVGSVVAVLLGVYGARHEPTFEPITTLGFRTMFEMKVDLAVVIGVLAVLQVLGALWLYGKLGIAAPRWLGTAHRITGALAILISLPVAFHCLWALGFGSYGGPTSTRVIVHSVAGCAIYGAIVVKIAAVRSKTAPGWFLPVAGGLLFAALIITVWTSAVWFIGENGWPDGTH